MNRNDAADSPSAADFKGLRERAGRTQAQVAALLRVTERQVQRWEAGETAMPSATWRFFRLTCGYYYPVDFVRQSAFVRTWDPRDTERDTIERGDIVELRGVEVRDGVEHFDGPLIRATLWLDRRNDGLIDEESYGAIVREFPERPAQAQIGKFRVEDRITFARSNVLRLKQRVPAELAV